MANGTPPASSGPGGAAGKKKKRNQRMLLIGGGALLVLLFLYMRSQSSGSTNATNATDQQALQDALAQQQATDAAMYGASAPNYGSGGGGGSTDLTGIESGLSTIDTDLQNLPSQIAGTTNTSGAGSAASAPPATTSPTATPPITINVGAAAQPTATKSNGVRMSTLTAGQAKSGEIAAPFGATKPTAPSGYEAVGLGSGNWAFRPIPKPPVRPSGNGHGTGARMTFNTKK